MIAARRRPARTQMESQKQPAAQVKTLLAPTGGLVTNQMLSGGQGAIHLENFWPTRDGISPRPGCATQCTVPTEVVTLFEHRGAGKYFAATAGAFYEFNASSSGALSSSVTGLTNGHWHTYEVQNSGGNYLLCVNGVDSLRRFDGTTWLTITGTGTGAITGVATTALSFVWGHRNRVFFIQKSSLSAWYLGTNSIAGAATELPLDATFRKGGFLLLGGTWSSDSGSGMDDRCFFMTDRGEVAIFSGSNPGDVANWSLEGVYDVGVLLGPKAVDSVGGDVLFGTKDGIIPLSAVVSKDPSQLSASSIAAAIAPSWRRSVDYTAGDWRLSKWETGGMLSALPLADTGDAVTIYAANMENGAWTTFSGWEASEIRQLGTAPYFGTRGGEIVRAWTGGVDNEAPFCARAMFAFDHLTDAASVKSMAKMQAVWSVRGALTYTLGAARDYQATFGAPPYVSSIPPDDALSAWDVGDWDVTPWGTDGIDYSVAAGWRAVPGIAFAFAPWVQLLSGSSAKLEAKLQRIDVAFVPGGSAA